MPMTVMLLLAAATAGAATEEAHLTYAPEVPPAIRRHAPATVVVNLETKEVRGSLAEGLEQDTLYDFWTFNGHVPGPFIRLREGDTMELHISNPKESSMDHNIDLHAVTGPGGGAVVTLVKPGESKTVRFKMLHPGFYVYHCAAPPVTDHIANGMYGVILVEPAKGLPKVDREFYVMQSEFYIKEDTTTEGLVHYDHAKALAENPSFVVFNGKVGALKGEGALQAKVGEKIRVYFGNIGPNLASSWHIIGLVMDRLWLQGSVTSPPVRDVQTTLVPAGGTSVAEFELKVPGDYTLVDHSIFRVEKGALGILHVEGKDAPDIYSPSAVKGK